MLHSDGKTDDVVRFPTWLSGITLTLTFVTFGFVVWAAFGKYRAAENFRSRESRIQALHSTIVRLDEVLTMSARMAAATGDPRWERRYRLYDPQLEAAIVETRSLVPGGSSLVAINATDDANQKLVTMETTAFALIRAGRRNAAHTILSSRAYERQKALYLTGLETVLKEQQERLRETLARARRRATLSLAAAGALVVSTMATWIVILASLRGMKAQLEQRITERAALLSASQLELIAARDATEAVTEINAHLGRQSALILNSTTDGIIGVGPDGQATFLNPAAARMLGRSLGDFEGKSIHEATHHSHPDGTPWPRNECPASDVLRRGEVLTAGDDTFWRADGSSFPVERSGTPLLDEAGNQLGAVITFRDVTERRAVDRLKSEFVSTVSHELRTPLTSIRGALGLLSSGMLGAIAEKGQRMLAIAVSNTDRLVRLINDILDLERLDSGKVELVRSSLDANTVLVQAMEGVQSMADQGGIRLALVPVTAALWGDSDRIIQTLTNLVGNAIKFSAPGTTVTLSGTARKADFVFCVADQGRGVPDEKLATIFGRFSQVDSSDSRDKGGSGLGLAICQSIVHAHGGRIWAKKNEPAGSRFQFTIPLKVSSPVAHPAIEHGPRTPSIVVVEDDLDLAGVMAMALQSRGFRTFHAVTGSDAIQMCRQHVPSLIVLDLDLPDMDGYAVVRALRESESLERIPLLVYSALEVGSADQARLRLGPTQFLTKSRCSLADFESHVVRLVDTVTEKANGEQHAA